MNLQFFKGSSTETVRKRDPKSAQHLAMDEAVFNLLSPLATRYGGSSIFGDAYPKSGTSTKQQTNKQSSPWLSTAYGESESGNGYWEQTESGNGNGVWVSYGSNQPSQTVSNGKLGSVQPSGNTTDPLTAFNNSILGRNLDYADLQHEMVNRNTVDLLGKVPGYLDQSNNALRNSELLASNYMNPYGASSFDYMNGAMLGDSSRLTGASENAIRKSEGLVDRYVNPYDASSFDAINRLSLIHI